MPDTGSVSEHYTRGDLLEAIREGVRKLGKSEATVTLEELGPVEEFHIGGRQASAEFLDQLNLRAEHFVLDVGCGLGGTARFAASRSGCRVFGVDLTDEYVAVGKVMTRWVRLDGRVSHQQGNATDLPFADACFDRAYMMHVGMNIADKSSLMQELARVLKPGGRLGIYDIMRTSDGELTFPVPWSSNPDDSALGTLEDYKQALQAAGFTIVSERNRHDFAVAFFDRLQASSAGGLPPLGLHIIMGANAPQKIANMVENVRCSRIAPIELIAEKSLT